MKFRTEFERQQAFTMAEQMKNEAMRLSSPTAAEPIAAVEPIAEPTKTTTTKKAKS